MSAPPWSGTIVVIRVESRMPAKPGEHVGEHEVPDLDHPDVDAGLGGADQVAARGDRVEPPPRPREDELEREHDPERPPELGVEVEEVLERLRPEDVLEEVAARHEHLRPREQVQRDAVQEEQHPERRDERGNAEERRDHPARQPDTGRDDERGRHPDPDREPCCSSDETT